jgi:phosphate transport system substrate-binding protein
MKKTIAATFVAIAILGGTAQAADQIRVVGSSTVYPFITSVAEKFGKGGKFKTPIVESTGTGGGFKLFCSGAGTDTPTATNASRRIKPDELLNCRKNNVGDVSEVKIGYDGIIIANSVAAKPFAFTLQDIALALGKKVPDPKNPKKLIDNPYKTWNQINKAFPNQKIEVYGPPPTSGTRDSFAEMVMEGGCHKWEAMKAAYADENDRKKACKAIREDGVFIESGENDNLIVQKLKANKNALGVFGYSFLAENKSVVQGSKIDGVAPSHDTIANGTYKVSRPLYVYVKRAHIGKIPGIKEFVTELVSDKAAGNFGYLAGRGLIAMPDAELKGMQKDVKEGKLLNNLAEERVDVEYLKRLAN